MLYQKRSEGGRQGGREDVRRITNTYLGAEGDDVGLAGVDRGGVAIYK
jgi:hypothetical protein